MVQWNKIIEFAEKYDKAAETLRPREYTAQSLDFILPIITLESFSCELYMKALITYENHNYPGTHNLLKLYRMLNGKTQNDILILYNDISQRAPLINVTPHTHNSFCDNLQACANLFENSRYFFEHDENALTNLTFFRIFSCCLSEYAKMLVA